VFTWGFILEHVDPARLLEAGRVLNRVLLDLDERK
jgi:hypothetical protein